MKLKFISAIFFCSWGMLVISCGTTKDTVASRSMQNLTSRYNILYNANELLKESERDLLDGYPDDYAQTLSVYKEPTEDFAKAALKNLDSIISKANTIISDKAQSEYVKDAYLLIGKINYLKTNFFNAAEFFNYTYDTYPDEEELRQQSLVWRARSLIHLNNLKEAADVLDTALKYIATGKKSVAEVYATEAQFNVYTGNNGNAIEMLKKAIKAGSSKANEIRWSFLLAQLQENENQLPEAYANYTAVVKSNAPFEMAFNANVNRIRIADGKVNNSDYRIKELKLLLKEDKNKDFTDQIYYRLGDIYMERGEKDQAIAQYNTALRQATKNQNQKGLTYLRLAEINFKDADYVKAKAYYDSTLMSLQPTYSGYETIRLKSTNLELLANRFKIISDEDTFQNLAKLSEEQREIRIGQLVREQVRKASGQSPSTPDTFTAGIDVPGKSGAAEGKFYFNNAIALSQGFTDFKKRWGNRKLEDNWRRSSKSAAEVLAMANVDPDAASLSKSNLSANLSIEDLTKRYHDNIPLTPAQMQQSKEKIINAYYDVAGFYKDELKDNVEAIKIYKQLLAKYPDNSNLAAIYYNLFRIYSETNQSQAEEYRNLVISRFPGSSYAKVLQNPGVSPKPDNAEVASITAYNGVYSLYVQRKYDDVIKGIAQAGAQFGKNPFSSQFAYLNALAVGRTQKLNVLEQSLNQLVAAYPDDKLITPLVKQHLEYIAANRESMERRTFAIIDFDPNEPRFVTEPSTVAQQQLSNQLVAKPLATKNAQSPPVSNAPVIQNADPDRPAAATANSMFSLPDSAEYYFVVNVADARTNLSSSRFGIGQFNRANFSQQQIKHQLIEVGNENQLIFVGSFTSLSSVKAYEQSIAPLMPSIMKVPAAKYNTFVITKTGLEKLVDKGLISTYLDFYRQH